MAKTRDITPEDIVNRLMQFIVFQRGQLLAVRDILVPIIETLPDAQLQKLFEEVPRGVSRVEESLRQEGPMSSDPEVIGELGRGYEDLMQSLSDAISLRNPVKTAG